MGAGRDDDALREHDVAVRELEPEAAGAIPGQADDGRVAAHREC